MLQGPGENAGVVDLGEGLAVRVQGREPQPPLGRRAVPGRGHRRRRDPAGHRRHGRAADRAARRAALRRPTDFSFDRAVGGHRALRQLRRRARPSAVRRSSTSATATTRSSTRCASGFCPPSASPARSASGAGNLVVLYGATTGRDGIGGASVLASQELSDEDEDKRPTVQIGDPFTGKKLIEASLELVEGGPRRVAAGPAARRASPRRSPRWPAAEAPALDVHLDRVPLREAGLAPVEIMISESQERMVGRRRARAARGRRGRLPQVGAALRRHRRGDGHGRAARVLRRRGDRRDPGRAPHRGDAALPRRDAPRERSPSRSSTTPTPAGATSCSRCSARRTSAAASHVFERYDHLVGSRTVRRPGLDAAVLRLRPSLPRPRASRWTGPAGRRRSTRAAAGRAPSSRPRATSRAPAGGRSRSPTASTSATPRSPRSPGSSPRRSRAWRARARCSGSRSSPATSRSTTRPTAARSTRRRSSAASAPSRRAAPSRAPGGRATSSCWPAAPSSRWTAPSTRRASSAPRRDGRRHRLSSPRPRSSTSSGARPRC